MNNLSPTCRKTMSLLFLHISVKVYHQEVRSELSYRERDYIKNGTFWLEKRYQRRDDWWWRNQIHFQWVHSEEEITTYRDNNNRKKAISSESGLESRDTTWIKERIQVTQKKNKNGNGSWMEVQSVEDRNVSNGRAVLPVADSASHNG